MTPDTPLRIAVADDERDTRQFLQEALTRMGHQVVTVAATGRELVEHCRRQPPDLIISDIRMPDMDGLQALSQINQEPRIPVILVTGHPELDYLARAGANCIMAYLVKPIKEMELKAAIALAVLRFNQFTELAHEAASLRQALEDRKLIERAKSIVIKRVNISEEDAFLRLRKIASDHNHKLVDVAQRVVAADEIFRQLERL